ncbi:MAG TPA: YafY family protein [Candidatus Sulfotelmatobacter sp.]|nr:YafY family protein [Candidatus Sulfotelmatobacter sp.]
MLNTSARLLRLLSLFQLRRYWSGAELSRRLEVTGRTLRRDVDRLRSLGYPVHSSSGVEGGYQLGAGATLPPLLLDDDEAVAVALGLRTSAQGGVSGMEEASMRALLKLEQVLPPRLRHRVVALHGFVVPLERRGPTVDANLLSSIAGACRDCECIRFKYQDRTGSPSLRAVEPHRLVHTGYRWYLVAWDLGRGDWRTFRMDRIDGKPRTSTRFKPRKPPEGDFAKFVSKSLSQVPYPVRARITLHAPMEALVKRIPPSAGVLESIGANSCLLQTGSYSLEGIAMHLSWLGVDFRVHEPPQLVDYISKLAARFAASIPSRPA